MRGIAGPASNGYDRMRTDAAFYRIAVFIFAGLACNALAIDINVGQSFGGGDFSSAGRISGSTDGEVIPPPPLPPWHKILNHLG